MNTIFWRSIKDRKTHILTYTIASMALLFMYIAIFPSFKDQQASLEQVMKSFPDSFMKAFNFDIKSFTTLQGYIATEQFSFVWPLLVMFLSIGYAGSALAGEIEKGTIEVILSHSVSRTKLFAGRYLSGVGMLAIFSFLSIMSSIPIAGLFGLEYSAQNFLTMTILGFMFGLGIYSIGMFLSAAFTDKGKVFFVSGMILVLMYVLNIISALKENLSDFKYASFFYYFNPKNALVDNQIDQWSYLVFIGLSLVLFILGIVIYNKKDIAT